MLKRCTRKGGSCSPKAASTRPSSVSKSAAHATGLPKFHDRANARATVATKSRQIHETLSSLSVDPKVIGQAKVDLDLMLSEFGPNPMLERLSSRLQSVIPRAIAPLKEQVRTFKAKSERADTLVDAISYAQQARNSLDQIRQLSDLDRGLERLQDEIDRSLQELNKLESDLSSARTAYQNHPSWPASAYKTSLGSPRSLSSRSPGPAAQPLAG